jgi:hypothetical protein
VNLRNTIARVQAQLLRHESGLWWIHSSYALALGIGFMWLGARNFAWLRVAAFHVTFIWITSILVTGVVNRRAADDARWRGARLVINYVNKNFYQQILFFILPVYHASATAWSANMVFVALLGLSAILSTIDLVYDRILYTNRWLAAGFFSFNAFAAVNVALPVLFAVSNHTALRLATLAAVLGFVTIAIRVGRLRRRRTWLAIAAGAVVVFAVSETFGRGLDQRAFRIVQPLTSLPAGFTGRVYATTAVASPVGLKDRVGLRWSQGGRRLWSSPSHDIVGGRASGFRLWSSVPIDGLIGRDALRLEVYTEAGQIVGRAHLQVETPR